MSPVKLLIVDDHPLFRQGLRDVLESHAEMIVVGEAGDGETAIEVAIALKPDVILMDVNLPTINGLQVTRKIKSSLPDVHIITITGYDDTDQIYHALRAGASAYCPKDLDPNKLIEVVLAVQAGDYVIDGNRMNYEELTGWLQEKLGADVDLLNEPDMQDGLFIPLSPREMEILEHVTKGSSNKEIAYKLGISHQTVKNHMTAILRKLQVEDRTQAAVYALRRGWVRLDDEKES